MTPELRQAITILQLSTLELDRYIENQLLENPLLDVGDDVLKNTESIEKVKEKNQRKSIGMSILMTGHTVIQYECSVSVRKK